LEDGSVDSILMANVLHGFIANDEDADVLREVVRVLKRGGRLGIVEFKKHAAFGPPKKVKLSPSDVIKRISAEGFSTLCEIDVGPHHYMVLLRKS
jgi:ubiquinone/menaquinone biosynthesis C-methylase UbiE